jgi:hypothetical protein
MPIDTDAILTAQAFFLLAVGFCLWRVAVWLAIDKDEFDER